MSFVSSPILTEINPYPDLLLNHFTCHCVLQVLMLIVLSILNNSNYVYIVSEIYLYLLEKMYS